MHWGLTPLNQFMQDKGDNVEARCRVVLRKDARLVHENAQCPVVLHVPFKNESDGRTRHSRRRDTLASRRPRSDDRRRRILYQILRRESKGAAKPKNDENTKAPTITYALALMHWGQTPGAPLAVGCHNFCAV